MARGPGRVGLRSAQAWWVPVMAVAVTAVVTAAVFKLVRFRRGSKGAQNRNDDDSEVAVEEVTSSEPYEPLIVSQEDWASLAETALGQEIQPTDRKLQLLVERSFPCDAVDILHALFQPGSTFWALWQQEQHHHHINIGDWLKESTPLGYTKWTRECKYRMPLNKLTSMGASFADNTEHQTVHHASKEAWTLSVSAVTANVPMGNLFKCILNLTANNETTSGRPRCCLRVYGDVVFHRHQPLKEALVRRPALNGMRSTYVHMLQLLKEQLQFSRQDSVASVPLPALAPGSEEILESAEEVAVQDEKPHAESVTWTCCTEVQDTQRLQEFVQTLLAVLVFFAVLLAAEKAAEGAPGTEHRQDCWHQIVACRDP